MDYDVVIIGGGAVGCCVARELSRLDLKICLLEKCEDVCSGTSKANSAIVHAGFDARPGTLKAKYNVLGNKMMKELSKTLDFDFKQNGSMVLCFNDDDVPKLYELYERGIKNGVQGISVISGEEAAKLEKNLSDNVVAALYAPTGGIVCPFGLTIAMAENACDNGVEFRFLTEAESIRKKGEIFVLETNRGEINAKTVVNAAGVYADRLHNNVCRDKIEIIPRKGDYCLLDREAGDYVSHTLFQLPNKYGKGVLVTPTVHGNLLCGPTSVDVEDKEETATDEKGLAFVIEKATLGVKNIPFGSTITSFAGVRAHEVKDDFILGEATDVPGFYDAAGIESPGLTCAPAIGVYIASEIQKNTAAALKLNWKETRKGIMRPANLNMGERAALIKEKPEYGAIVCRCEEVSEGEIIDAVTRTLGAVSLDGIKRRVRQGMGRCQAGFCTPRTMEILSKYKGIDINNICKNMPGSEILAGEDMEVAGD